MPSSVGMGVGGGGSGGGGAGGAASSTFSSFSFSSRGGSSPGGGSLRGSGPTSGWRTSWCGPCWNGSWPGPKRLVYWYWASSRPPSASGRRAAAPSGPTESSVRRWATTV